MVRGDEEEADEGEDGEDEDEEEEEEEEEEEAEEEEAGNKKRDQIPEEFLGKNGEDYRAITRSQRYQVSIKVSI